MANNYEIRIKIEIKESEEPESAGLERMKGGGYRRVVSQERGEGIDESEEEVVKMSYEAMRAELGRHWSEVTQKYVQRIGVGAEGYEVKRYRVDGEVGRIEFEAYYAKEGSVRSEEQRGIYPLLRGREWHRTRGWKEIAFEQGVVNESYRKAGEMLNRVRHQSEGTPVRSLCESAEREGMEVVAEMEAKATEVLTAHQFSVSGCPLIERKKEQKQVWQAMEADKVNQARRQVAPDVEWEIEMRENPLPYEDPACTTHVSLDDVGACHQKERRNQAAEPTQTLEYVHTTVAHIQQQNAFYLLCGAGVSAVLRLLLAFLLHNDLLRYNLLFFVDGQRSLYTAVLDAFAWFAPLHLMLDWYHLDKRCREYLSMALKGKVLRNDYLEHLLLALWHGCTDSALTLLLSIDPEHVKNQEYLDKLVGYIERNRPFIPCYSVRKRLGLRTSSNRGEKANDLLVSARQKHNGTSWSNSGSLALATLSALVRNFEFKQWLDSHSFAFILFTPCS